MWIYKAHNVSKQAESEAPKNNNKNNNNKNKFLSDLDRRFSRSSGDDRETSFLFQCISVLLFPINSVLLHDAFVWTTTWSSSLSSIFYFCIFSYPRFYEGLKKFFKNNNNNNNNTTVNRSWHCQR